MARVFERVFKPEKVYRNVGVLSYIDPIFEPCVICFAYLGLEENPVRLDGVLCQLIVEC